MKEERINLLPQKKKKLVDKLIFFGLHYFRYIIVITQIAVISVFFFRFYIDQQIIDYKESFAQKQQILTLTKPLVIEASEISKKTAEASKIIEDQNYRLGTINYIFSNVPTGLSISSFTWDSKIDIKGEAITPSLVQAMQNRLSKSGHFKEVSVVDIAKNDLGSFNYSLLIVTKQNGQPKN